MNPLDFPNLLVRALDDLHRISRRMETIAELNANMSELNRRLSAVERQLADIARTAKTTDTVLRAMPGSKVVTARAKAQRKRARPDKPKGDA